MNKLYVGNLPPDVNEGTLKEVFQEKGISCESIIVKKGFGFVDLKDQTAAGQAIDKIHGVTLMGHVLKVEHAASGTDRRSSKLQITNFPTSADFGEFKTLLDGYGPVKKCEQVPGKEHIVLVLYDTPEEAQKALEKLNGMVFESVNLKVEYANGNRQPRSPGGRSPRMQGSKPNDVPLRILVGHDFVGAIIGKQGTTIRQITQDTRARVDVHRKENIGSLEKVISIYGSPENCTKACMKILEVMKAEAENTSKGDVFLKVLAHNNLIGRIIGKSGKSIKTMMEETDSNITVSSLQDMNQIYNLERTITVKGSIENMSKAEALISAKIRQSLEHDLAAIAPQSMMFPGLPPMALMSTMPGGYSRPVHQPRQYNPYTPNPGYPGPSSPGREAPNQEITYLYIPNAAVGAIIGTKGGHIRSIIRFSGAHVKIAPLEKVCPIENTAERKVSITGSAEAQWKAQYLIFEKLREEGYAGTEEVRLRAEITVPTAQVGRIIGKGGQNVRELQRITGSIIKLPEDSQNTHGEETPVHIIGTFYSVQSAQRRIRAMMNAFLGIGVPPNTRGALMFRRRGARSDN